MFCRSLFVLLKFFSSPLCCLFFFDLRILITSLWYLQTLHKIATLFMFGLFPLHFEISFKYLSLILKILVLQYMHAFYIYEGFLHHSSAFMIQRWSVSNCDWFGFVVFNVTFNNISVVSWR